MKAETLKNHKKSQEHITAAEMHQNLVAKPAAAPAVKAQHNMLKQAAGKVNLKLRNVHALLKNKKSFRDYLWL